MLASPFPILGERGRYSVWCDVVQCGAVWCSVVQCGAVGGDTLMLASPFPSLPLPHSGLCTMAWLQSVGSIKLNVSFAEYGLFCRALLQKRPIILSSLQIEATAYLSVNVLWRGYDKVIGLFCGISSLL